MYGHIFAGMERFVSDTYGSKAWAKVVNEAGAGIEKYLILQEYPDSEVESLITTISGVAGKSSQDIQFELGQFMAEYFARTYKVFFKPSWDFYELLENVENTVHRELRLYNPGMTPPELSCSRVGSREVLIKYNSPRHMCAFARGLVQGFATHYGEEIEIVEDDCMLDGKKECLIKVKGGG
ncbi:MAG: heme NO-binding domain-containing protein [Nitrospira sp.]|nr:heme NO-binding domain-containing protein [bacterium]MBL7048797.1 heme NO-binding domain-containing protein [Nitrospira sp.]